MGGLQSWVARVGWLVFTKYLTLDERVPGSNSGAPTKQDKNHGSSRSRTAPFALHYRWNHRCERRREAAGYNTVIECDGANGLNLTGLAL